MQWSKKLLNVFACFRAVGTFSCFHCVWHRAIAVIEIQVDELGCATFPHCFRNDFTLRWCQGFSIIAAPLGCWKNFRLALSLSSIKQRLRGADRFQHCLYSHRNDKFNARATLRLTFKTHTYSTYLILTETKVKAFQALYATLLIQLKVITQTTFVNTH